MDPSPLPIQVIGAGIFQLANVTLDKRQRSVSFPAVVNMNQGPMEYFLVTSYGKVHESILRTDTLPQHIHIAMLLLDVKTDERSGPPDPAPKAGLAGSPKAKGGPNTISSPEAETLAGDRVAIEVSWNLEGKETTHPSEDMVSNLANGATMNRGNWAYNGSEVIGGTFQAQVTGSLVSLITDRHSLINNTGVGHDNDDIWAVNPKDLPPVNTPVRVTLKLGNDQTAN